MGRDGLFPSTTTTATATPPAADAAATIKQEQAAAKQAKQQRAAAAAAFALGNAAIPCTVPRVKLSELDLPLGTFDAPVVIEVDGAEGGEAR